MLAIAVLRQRVFGQYLQPRSRLEVKRPGLSVITKDDPPANLTKSFF